MSEMSAFSIQRNLSDLATIFTPLRIFCDRNASILSSPSLPRREAAHGAFATSDMHDEYHRTTTCSHKITHLWLSR